MKLGFARRLALALLSIAVYCTCLIAQPNMRPLTVELAAFGGGVFDLPSATATSSICTSGTTDCHSETRLGKKFMPTVGGEISVALRPWVAIYGEYGYVFPDHNSASVIFGQSSDATTVDRHYWLANAGIEFNFPTVHGVIPVVRLGGGMVHESYNYYDVGVNVSPAVIHYADARGIPDGSAGAGIKWYLRERQGLKFMVDGFYLGHSVQDFQPSPFFGTAFVTRRSGGSVTVGYFLQLGR
jgi:hypothetical protein